MSERSNPARLLTSITPPIPSASPTIFRSVSLSESQTAENTAPNSGAVELRIASSDAGRYRAAKLNSRNGMPEFTMPITTKCFQFSRHPGLNRTRAKNPARAAPPRSTRMSAVTTGPRIGAR